MARSSYIYLVEYQPGVPIAAFTVKHELVSYLRVYGENVPPDVRVWRMGDGTRHDRHPVLLPLDELLKKES